MPKRSRKDDDSDDYFRHKLRKLEKKLQRRRKQKAKAVISSSSSSSVGSPVPSLQEDVEPEQPLIDLQLSETLHPANIPSDNISSANSAAIIPECSVPPSAPDQPVTEKPELDDDIMILLGETPTKEKKYGVEIQKDLAVRWEHISVIGLTKEARKEIVENILIPVNCKMIDAPILNPEIKAALSETLLKKDKAIEAKQKQHAIAISCLSEALTSLLASEHKDCNAIKSLIKTGRIMCDTQHNDSLTRRSLICSAIKKELKDQLYDTEIDKFLFGEKLADTLKAAKAINKSASEMKTPAFKAPVPKNKSGISKNFKFQQQNHRPPSTLKDHTQAPAATAPPARRRPPPPPPSAQPTRSRARAAAQRR